MILVFGGTTEGRRTAGVLEEAATPYFYSTRGAEQEVELVCGRRLVGAMDCDQMVAFSREHDIRLIIDAAHPFAAELHRNLICVAAQLQVPLLRYDRQPTFSSPDVIWCEDYADALRLLEQRGITRLLALTGVQTIARLRPFWRHHDCWFRILDREDSRSIAREAGFPEQRLIQVSDEELRSEAVSAASASLATLLRQLQPQAILTKESGSSGGFQQKVTTAQAVGVQVFVVRRPAYPPSSPELSAVHLEVVYGPHGLRRNVERLVPGFFPLRTGLTTGTCATAAVKAALLSLQGEACEAVWVQLPDGERLVVDVQQESPGSASVIKDFSDDPDVTRGCRITAQVELHPRETHSSASQHIRFLQGEGVGRVTLPGLGIPVGEPAVNPTPRQMISAEVSALTSEDVDITLSVEGGRELALRTFNERVGVVDGISIIGTSGIVRPLSNEAFVESIGRELSVARAIGCEAIGLASGKQGEEALLAQEPSLRVVHYGNFIGETLLRAHELGFRRVVLGIMIGKAVKLAEGYLDTHSHKVLMNKAFLAEVAASVGVVDAASLLEPVAMARSLWNLMPAAFFEALRTRCLTHCRKAFPTGELDVKLIRN